MNSAGERAVEGMTGTEETRLIEYLEKLGWPSSQILDLLKYIRR